MPEQLRPASAGDWSDDYLALLKVQIVPAELPEFCEMIGIAAVSTSPSAVELKAHLEHLTTESVASYEKPESFESMRNQEDVKWNILRDPIVKALFLLEKYSDHESMVDSFVALLLHRLQYYDGMLFPVQQLRLKLKFGPHDEKLSIADFTIMDLLAFYRMAVVEDKSRDNQKVNSLPQLQSLSTKRTRTTRKKPQKCDVWAMVPWHLHQHMRKRRSRKRMNLLSACA